MKKSNFVALVLGTVSGVLFALGMCMALLPEWNAFLEGFILGSAGLVLGLITFIIWCKLENKKIRKLSGRNFLKTIYGVLGLLVFGGGFCLCIVWEKIVIGTLVGLVGIVMLISLIPMIKGIK